MSYYLKNIFQKKYPTLMNAYTVYEYLNEKSEEFITYKSNEIRHKLVAFSFAIFDVELDSYATREGIESVQELLVLIKNTPTLSHYTHAFSELEGLLTRATDFKSEGTHYINSHLESDLIDIENRINKWSKSFENHVEIILEEVESLKDNKIANILCIKTKDMHDIIAANETLSHASEFIKNHETYDAEFQDCLREVTKSISVLQKKIDDLLIKEKEKEKEKEKSMMKIHLFTVSLPSADGATCKEEVLLPKTLTDEEVQEHFLTWIQKQTSASRMSL